MDYQIIPVTAFAQNCTLIWCEETKQAAVVDPGGDIEDIVAAAVRRGVTIVKILLTHGHIDHAGGAAELSQRLAVAIEGPQRGDDYWIRQLVEQARMFGFPGRCASFTPDRWLNDGETVSFGKVVLEVLHTPGHTPGHVCFFHRASKLALVGDVLFAGSIGRTDFPGGNYDALIGSIRQTLWPLGDNVEFIPGHGPMSTFGEERRNNPFVADGV
jgi:glyoxylase-like metal-dependent hydrolase (beta-lactamase superfamily II)